MLDNQLTEKQSIIIQEKAEFWQVDSSTSAKNCKNYIREIVDTLDLQPNPSKPVVALSIGTYFSN